MTPQQKYYLKHKDDPYFKLCQAVALIKYRDNNREKYNEYMREYKRRKKEIGQILTETGQG